MEALEQHMISWYLRNWGGNYLNERSVEFPVEGGNIIKCEVDRH